jgi:hypothetical protein
MILHGSRKATSVAFLSHLCVAATLVASCTSVSFTNANNVLSGKICIWTPINQTTSIFARDVLLHSLKNIFHNNLAYGNQACQYAIALRITSWNNGIVSIDDCNIPGVLSAGNGAFSCSGISAGAWRETVLATPKIENIQYGVEWWLLDRKKQVILLHNSTSLPAQNFESIGDAGDGKTDYALQNQPSLASVRHEEALQNASNAYMDAMAQSIYQTTTQQLRNN